MGLFNWFKKPTKEFQEKEISQDVIAKPLPKKEMVYCGLWREPRRAKIKSCCREDLWYKDKVGQEVEVGEFATYGIFDRQGRYYIFSDLEFLE